MQSLESPHIRRGNSNHGPRVTDPVLNLLLGLNPVDNPVSLHDLDWVRVGPGADEDAVAADDNSAGKEGSVGGGLEGGG